jgi:hypothetical protein
MVRLTVVCVIEVSFTGGSKTNWSHTIGKATWLHYCHQTYQIQAA